MRNTFFCVKTLRMKDLLTTAEAAEIVGLSDARIRQLVLAGILPAEKFGKANLIKRADLKVLENRKLGRPAKIKKAA